MRPNEHFLHVMERLSGRVYSQARYSLANASDAEDVTQEVFTRLWENWNTIDPDRVEGWLIRATSNACVDFRRRQASRRTREAAALNHADTPDPASAVVAAEARRHVTQAIARLDEPFRSIVILREIEGRSYQEISEHLSVSLAQVKVYLHRARARIAGWLAPTHDETARHPEPQKGAVHVP